MIFHIRSHQFDTIFLNTSFPLFQVCTSVISRDLWYLREQISPACVSTRYRKRFRASSARFDTFLPLDLRRRRIFLRIFRVPRSLESTPSCSSFFLALSTPLSGYCLVRSDRRQLKAKLLDLCREKPHCTHGWSVKGSISRLFRNKSRANREIHRGANIEQYYLAIERSLGENFLGIHYVKFLS